MMDTVLVVEYVSWFAGSTIVNASPSCCCDELDECLFSRFFET